MLSEEEDSEVEFLPSVQAELLVRCEEEISRAGLPPPLSRHWSPVFPQHTSSGQSGEERERGPDILMFLCRNRARTSRSPSVPVEHLGSR